MPSPTPIAAIGPAAGIEAVAIEVDASCPARTGATTDFDIIHEILFGHRFILD